MQGSMRSYSIVLTVYFPNVIFKMESTLLKCKPSQFLQGWGGQGIRTDRQGNGQRTKRPNTSSKVAVPALAPTPDFSRELLVQENSWEVKDGRAVCRMNNLPPHAPATEYGTLHPTFPMVGDFRD